MIYTIRVVDWKTTMHERILKLDIGGRPIRWVSCEEGALLYCRNQVAWVAGEHELVLRGGRSRATGRRSILRINSIVATTAVDQSVDVWAGKTALTNSALFRRDEDTCLYCSETFSKASLTRDHVVPVSRGGTNTWENVVTACRACNQRKDDLLLEECGMALLATPYAPNAAEGLILNNRRILFDQMNFLKRRVGSNSRIQL
jgi:hypothetical protein